MIEVLSTSTLFSLPEQLYGTIKKAGYLNKEPILYGDPNLLKNGDLYYIIGAKQVYRYIKSITKDANEEEANESVEDTYGGSVISPIDPGTGIDLGGTEEVIGDEDPDQGENLEEQPGNQINRYYCFETIFPYQGDTFIIPEDERGIIRKAGMFFDRPIYSGDPNLVKTNDLFYHDALPYISKVTVNEGTITLASEVIDEDGDAVTKFVNYEVNTKLPKTIKICVDDIDETQYQYIVGYRLHNGLLIIENMLEHLKHIYNNLKPTEAIKCVLKLDDTTILNIAVTCNTVIINSVEMTNLDAITYINRKVAHIEGELCEFAINSEYDDYLLYMISHYVEEGIDPIAYGTLQSYCEDIAVMFNQHFFAQITAPTVKYIATLDELMELYGGEEEAEEEAEEEEGGADDQPSLVTYQFKSGFNWNYVEDIKFTTDPNEYNDAWKLSFTGDETDAYLNKNIDQPAEAVIGENEGITNVDWIMNNFLNSIKPFENVRSWRREEPSERTFETLAPTIQVIYYDYE